MPDDAAIAALEAELLEELSVDYVMIPRMTWHAEQVLGTSDECATRELVLATLPRFLDHPDAKLITFQMNRQITDAEELARLLAAEWPETGLRPDEFAGWLVKRDYDVTHRRSE
jgi:hypothetical protein